MKLNLNTLDLTEDNSEEFFEEKPYGSRKDSEEWEETIRPDRMKKPRRNDNKRKFIED